ncbi:hypothetical protein OIV83_000806 [Microbotryomycetes sp. JL201]|nr:hypothetical protein OIV83_000806 [Microbotryomycetes sp. JL201]
MLGLIKSLPKYSGPYKVSTLELEIPCAHQEFGTATLKRTGECALQLDSTAALVFYPADEHKRGSGTRQPWVSRPLAATAQGYAAFTGAPAWILKALVVLLASRIKLPIEADVPLATPKQPSGIDASDQAERASSASTLVSNSAATTPPTVANGRFPLIVFSHGLGGTRTTYSQYCGELASLGYIVAAIEHRDGTAPVSIVKSPTAGAADRQVFYIRPDDIEFKAPNKTLTQLEYRKQQLEMRYEEIRQVLRVFERINNGEGDKVAHENLRKTKGSEMWLPQWRDKIDLQKPCMAGHSFGGATTLQILRAGTSFPFVSGIALDPWIDPIPQLSMLERFTSPNSSSEQETKPTATPKEQLDIKVPLLAINSEAFTKWSSHYGKVYEIVKRVQHARSWFMTLCGSVHMSFSDFPLLSPLVARKSGSRVDPRLGMTLFVEATREFLTGDDMGAVLGKQVVPGDENGTRPNEGGKGGEPMSPVGDMRMHYRPNKESRL